MYSISLEASFLLENGALLDPDYLPDDLLFVYATSATAQASVNHQGAEQSNAIDELPQHSLLEKAVKKLFASVHKPVQEATIDQRIYKKI